MLENKFEIKIKYLEPAATKKRVEKIKHTQNLTEETLKVKDGKLTKPLALFVPPRNVFDVSFPPPKVPSLYLLIPPFSLFSRGYFDFMYKD